MNAPDCVPSELIALIFVRFRRVRVLAELVPFVCRRGVAAIRILIDSQRIRLGLSAGRAWPGPQSGWIAIGRRNSTGQIEINSVSPLWFEYAPAAQARPEESLERLVATRGPLEPPRRVHASSRDASGARRFEWIESGARKRGASAPRWTLEWDRTLSRSLVKKR